jgi:hypothetical protein
MRRPVGFGADRIPGEPLHVLIYRYFFFGWMFRDVTRGSFLERAAAWRTNHEMRKYLPIYLRRWLVIFLSGYGLGVLFEKGFMQTYAAAGCYSGSCISASVILIIAISWFSLR